jgi:hypothetical protein
MIYKVTWALEPYPSPQFSGHWCVMSRVYDGTGQEVYADSLSGPFKDKALLESLYSFILATPEEVLNSGDQWRGIRLP